jgi:hypothetical protein
MIRSFGIVLAALSAAGCINTVDQAVTDDVAGLAQALEVAPTWRGDLSGCHTAPADRTIRTLGGDEGGTGEEFGVRSSDDPNTGHRGCDGAYIVDFLLPERGTNTNPGWDAAWVNAYLRNPPDNSMSCEDLWQNQKIYAYNVYQGERRIWLLGENSRVGEPICLLSGDAPKWWVANGWEKLRIVSQLGRGDSWGIAQYLYMVTDRGGWDPTPTGGPYL